jgi:cell division septation protein DedD
VIGAAWVAGAQAVDEHAAALPLPQRAPLATTSAIRVPTVDPGLVAASPRADAGQSATAAPRVGTPTIGSRRPPATAAVAGARGSFTILVASFKRPESAARVVDELTNAGFGARAVDRAAGPERGRLLVVMISGYTSAIDVQRDLQQIRALPGGYTDARVVEHE